MVIIVYLCLMGVDSNVSFMHVFGQIKLFLLAICFVWLVCSLQIPQVFCEWSIQLYFIATGNTV